MKPNLLTIPLVLIALAGQSTAGSAKNTQTKPQLPPTLASKKIYVRNTSASELVRRINEVRDQYTKPKDAVELTAKDAYKAIIVRGTPEAFTEMQELCKVLDVKPRIARVGLRLIKIERTRLGVDKESLYESSFVNVMNGVKKEVTFKSGASETKLVLIPHINGDDSVSLGVAFDISRESDLGRYSSSSTTYRRLVQPNDWIMVGALSLSREDQASFPFPTYRLEATIAEAK